MTQPTSRSELAARLVSVLKPFAEPIGISFVRAGATSSRSKEHGAIAASVGCALSRARTGMRSDEMTCALPGARLARS